MYSFLLETESNLGSKCGQKNKVNEKFPIKTSGVEPATFRLVVFLTRLSESSITFKNKISVRLYSREPYCPSVREFLASHFP